MTVSYTLHHGDNRDLYEQIGAVQAVITDPPYGAEVHSKDKVGRENGSNGSITNAPVPFDQLATEDVAQLAAFCRSRVNGWALIFCQTEQITMWRPVMEGMGQESVRYFRPMLWIKPNAKPNLRGNGPGIGHEVVQSYWCGSCRQTWNGGGKVGVFYHPTRNDYIQTKHPTSKPVSLMKELVRYFTRPGDTIFDPFMGCGATGVAALELGRNFIGIEKNLEYYEEAERRMKIAAAGALEIPMPAKQTTLLGDAAFGSIGTRRRLERRAKEKEAGDADV